MSDDRLTTSSSSAPAPAAMSPRSARPAGPEDRLRRKPRDAGRHLPQRRLHPVQGAAARLRTLRARPATRWPAWASRSRTSSSISRPMLAHKDKAVEDLTGGIEFLFKKNKVDWLKGWAHQRQGQRRGQPSRRQTAPSPPRTSSSPPGSAPPPSRASRSTRSTWSSIPPARWSCPKVPKTSGRDRRRRDRAGAWLGLAAARRRRSPCVEFLDQILPGMDGDIAKEANTIFKKQGIEFRLATKVTGAPSRARRPR